MTEKTRHPLRKIQPYRPRADTPHVRRGGAFATWMAERGYSPRTIELYGQIVRRVANYLTERGSTLARATEGDIHEFWATVPATRSSRAGVRYALVAYYRYRGRADGGPAAALELPPAPYRLPRPFSADALGDLLAAARQLGGHHRVIAELLAYTGCRMNEMRTAAWHQFDLETAQPVWYIAGKGAQRRGPKPRQVPLHPRLADTLRWWRTQHRGSVVLFPSDRSRDGYRSASWVAVAVGEVCDVAGVARVTPHRWRHTVATLALENSRDLRGVQELLGHASLQSTQIYTGVTTGRLTDIVRHLPA